jgi:hypothetical protein
MVQLTVAHRDRNEQVHDQGMAADMIPPSWGGVVAAKLPCVWITHRSSCRFHVLTADSADHQA